MSDKLEDLRKFILQKMEEIHRLKQDFGSLGALSQLKAIEETLDLVLKEMDKDKDRIAEIVKSQSSIYYLLASKYQGRKMPVGLDEVYSRVTKLVYHFDPHIVQDDGLTNIRVIVNQTSQVDSILWNEIKLVDIVPIYHPVNPIFKIITYFNGEKKEEIYDSNRANTPT